jgi:hypothetical protein
MTVLQELARPVAGAVVAVDVLHPERGGGQPGGRVGGHPQRRVETHDLPEPGRGLGEETVRIGGPARACDELVATAQVRAGQGHELMVVTATRAVNLGPASPSVAGLRVPTLAASLGEHVR